jgi:hypothetical protein
VIYMGVSDDDGSHLQCVAREDGLDPLDFIAGVDDYGFAGGLVAEDGAVALERADRNDFVKHPSGALFVLLELQILH